MAPHVNSSATWAFPLKVPRSAIAVKMGGRANSHNVSKYVVGQWNTSTMAKPVVQMKINLVPFVQMNATPDFS